MGRWGVQKNPEYVIKSDLKDKMLYCPNEFVHDCSSSCYYNEHGPQLCNRHCQNTVHAVGHKVDRACLSKVKNDTIIKCFAAAGISSTFLEEAIIRTV